MAKIERYYAGIILIQVYTKRGVFMNISIAGTGYFGLVTAVCLAKIGYNVTCVDIDEKNKYNEIGKGSYI